MDLTCRERERCANAGRAVGGVFWATYRRTADGGATLHRSQVRYLDRSSPTWTMQLVLPDTCGPWYVASGAWSIPQTLKPGVVPFGRGKLNWETAEHC